MKWGDYRVVSEDSSSTIQQSLVDRHCCVRMFIICK